MKIGESGFKMPFTPIHIIAATPLKILFPKHFSLIWFSIVNILIDVEVLYYLILLEWPIHRFFHSLWGVSIIGFSCFILSIILKQKKIPSFLSCFFGAYSHHFLDYWYHNGLDY